MGRIEAPSRFADPGEGGAQPFIELRGIRKTYRTGELSVEVLHGVSLAIWPGEFVAILGASGSGKSTLMNILGCLDRPTGGQYLLEGQDVARLDRDALASLRCNVFGFVFQQYNLLPHATAAENVEIPAVYAGAPRAERQSRVAALLRRLGLGDRLHHRPSQLSGGQQQRVSIARALMNGGRVILADEPTGALDSASGREVIALLHELNAQGHTIILITHDPRVAAEAGRRIEIADGRIVADERSRAAPPAGPRAEPPRLRHAGPLGELRETLRMAFRSMRANAFRTVLTLLGIIIGVSSVIAMQAVGSGAQESVLARIQAMGTNLLVVRPGAPNTRGGAVSTLTADDAADIALLPGVVAAVPEISGSITARFGNIDYQTSATATSAEYTEAQSWPVTEGVFFSQADMDAYAPVAVLGKTVADILFPYGQDPVGQYVLLNNVPFQTIGVMSEKGATGFGTDQDDVLFVPLTSGGLRLFGKQALRSITVQVADTAQIDAMEQEITTLLKQRHGVEDFQIRNMASILETATATTGTFTLLLGSIAAISLLVGGIGVMNIMLVSVSERTREIGIRMATGARSSDIQLQFLTEALVVCAVGGLLGVGGGLGIAWAVGKFGMPAAASPGPVFLAFGCSALIGLVFGFLPARKAARLDPVVALSAD